MTLNNPNITVSIVIPVYGVSDYIERCIGCVMHQTYENIECIVIDDASPDDSIAKCERMMVDYQGPIRFSILHHEHNRGMSAARNTGLQAASGEYIYFLDGDDAITFDCIEKLVKPVHNDPTIEMVMGSFERRANGSPVTRKQRRGVKFQEKDIPKHERVRDSFFNNELHVNAWNKLIKRDFLMRYQLFFEEGYLWEDLLWTFFVMKHLSHLYTIPNVTYYQLKRPHSVTTGTIRDVKQRHWGAVYEKIAQNFTPEEEAREAKHYLPKFCQEWMRRPEIKSFHRAASLFKKALSDGNHRSALTLLSIASFAAKRAVNVKCFFNGVKILV